MDNSLLKQYRDLCERIGKAYSDLEVFEAKRNELEKQLFGASSRSYALPLPTKATNGFHKHVDKQANAKTAEFLKRHFLANKIATPQMLMTEHSCTEGAAITRLRRAAKDGLGKRLVHPFRLERN